MRFNDFDALYDYLIDVTEGPFDENFGDLPEMIRNLHVVAIFTMEIMNGGLCQFFVNNGEEYASLVSDALIAVGLDKVAAMYNAFLSDSGISMSDMESFEIDGIDEFEEQTERYPFDDFDDAFYELSESLDMEQAMLDYANAHAAD